MSQRQRYHPTQRVIPATPVSRQVGHRCEVAGCCRATSEAKPFCIEHLVLSPYVAELLGRVAAEEGSRSRRRVG